MENSPVIFLIDDKRSVLDVAIPAIMQAIEALIAREPEITEEEKKFLKSIKFTVVHNPRIDEGKANNPRFQDLLSTLLAHSQNVVAVISDFNMPTTTLDAVSDTSLENITSLNSEGDQGMNLPLFLKTIQTLQALGEDPEYANLGGLQVLLAADASGIPALIQTRGNIEDVLAQCSKSNVPAPAANSIVDTKASSMHGPDQIAGWIAGNMKAQREIEKPL
jgi:hypothetical protein